MLLTLACSDYRLAGDKPEPRPSLEASPEVVELAGACDVERVAIQLRNSGAAALEVLGAAVEGAGWNVDAPDLPLRLAPGGTTSVVVVAKLEGQAGAGRLLLASNDPEAPLLEIPLSAEPNAPPSAMVLAPAEDAWVPADEALVLDAIVTDPDSPAADLVATWTSSLAGILATVVPAPDGRARWTWPADRPAGPQTIQVSTYDRCGAFGEYTIYYCQEGPWTYDALSFSAWLPSGTATEDAEGVLVVSGADAVGAAFAISENLDAGSLEASFTYRAEGLAGFSITLLDVDRREGYLGGDGCGLGYGGGAACTGGPALPGWSIEVDLYADDGVDATAVPHVAFTLDGILDDPLLVAPIDVDPLGEHTVDVVVASGTLSVVLDGAEILAGELPVGLEWRGNLGLTGATTAEGGSLRLVDATVVDPTCG